MNLNKFQDYFIFLKELVNTSCKIVVINNNNTPKIPKILLNLFNFICNGVNITSCSWINWLIFPISVFFPVFITKAIARPFVIWVPAKTSDFLSPKVLFDSTFSSITFLSTGSDSPVNADSTTAKLNDSTSLQSAGTKSPASKTIKSPITSSVDGIFINFPSR